MIPNDARDLPRHSVRVSRRARRVHLRVTPAKGLEVVLPEGEDPGLVPDILRENQGWIGRQLARLEQHNAECLIGDQEMPPHELNLRAVDEVWRVDYQRLATKQAAVIERAGKGVVLNCEVSDRITARSLLQDWLREKAKARLIPWLVHTAQETGLSYRHVRIKSQKTLWGSCSSRRAINLNYKLIFLPPEVARYVLIHELCHTRHLNHSPKFWALVASFEPDYPHLETALKDAWRYLPTFLE